MELEHPDSCKASNVVLGSVCGNQLNNVEHITDITADNVALTLKNCLLNPGSVLILELEGRGNHVFAVTGQDDHALISQAAQEQHLPLNKSLMLLDKLVENMKTMMKPDVTIERRKQAVLDTFKTPIQDSFGDHCIKIVSAFRGDLSEQLEGLQRPNPNGNIPGINQDPSVQLVNHMVRPRDSSGLVPNAILTPNSMNLRTIRQASPDTNNEDVTTDKYGSGVGKEAANSDLRTTKKLGSGKTTKAYLETARTSEQIQTLPMEELVILTKTKT